jgi:hypothetical protein
MMARSLGASAALGFSTRSLIRYTRSSSFSATPSITP